MPQNTASKSIPRSQGKRRTIHVYLRYGDNCTCAVIDWILLTPHRTLASTPCVLWFDLTSDTSEFDLLLVGLSSEQEARASSTAPAGQMRVHMY
jgi:hypothetical protein